MFAKIGLLIAIPFILLGMALVTTDTAVVDVREEGTHLVVPVPLPLVHAALAFVPREESSITCPKLWRYRDAIAQVVEELDRAPDGELVRVVEPGTFVSITKEGRSLGVRVRDDGTEVDVKLPLAAARNFLARLEGDTFTAKDLLASVTHTMSGRVVQVRDGDTRVKVSIW